MADKKGSKSKTVSKSPKAGREVRRVRTMNMIFLVITAILIFSMILAAVSKY